MIHEQNPGKSPDVPQEQDFSNSNHVIEPSVSNASDSMLLDMDMSGYDKSLKTGRIWLYVLAGFEILMGIYEAYQVRNQGSEVMWMVFGMEAAIGLMFFACAMWSFKKPYAAFVTALLLYVLLSIVGMAMDASNIYKGIIIKILLVIALVRAIKNARELEDMKKSFSIDD